MHGRLTQGLKPKQLPHIELDPDKWTAAEGGAAHNRHRDRFTFEVSRATVGSVDFKTPAPERFRLRLAAYLANEPHVLKLVPRGDGAVTVDAFEVFEPPVK